ncbi:hypothetical protein I4U23_011118 [Adineta vaga]|nr:hypothetical protein I4U23_011118 [Adineta vaga]
MINLTRLFYWFYNHIYDYNLFASETSDNEINNNRFEEFEAIIKRQKYTTWIYVLFVFVTLDVIFYITLLRSQNRTITILEITRIKFEELRQQHGERLSCRCLKTNIPYKNFVSITPIFHPICSSFFINQLWINELYITYDPDIDVDDFRQSASAQFKILANLCSLSKDKIFQDKVDFDNENFANIELLSKNQLQSKYDSNDLMNCDNENEITQAIITYLHEWRSTYSQMEIIPPDWGNHAFSQFQLLSDLYRLANKTVNDTVNRFLLEFFITSNVIHESDFNQRLNITIDQLLRSLTILFSQFVESSHLFVQIDQPFNQIGSTSSTSLSNLISTYTVIHNDDFYFEKYQVKFVLIGPYDDNTNSITCICALNPDCQYPFSLFKIDYMEIYYFSNYTMNYTIEGMNRGCFPIDSLLTSTLECFYSNSNCFSIILNYIKDAYNRNAPYPTLFSYQPLIYDPKSSRFPPKTSISFIIKELMIEKWNSLISYKHYYEVCAPSYCVYTATARTNTSIDVLVILISMISSVTMILRIITPQLVKVFCKLLKFILKKLSSSHQHASPSPSQQQQQQQDQSTIIIDLNVFTKQDFRNNVDTIKTKHYVGIYTIINPHILTETFDKPNFDFYNSLQQKYGDELRLNSNESESIKGFKIGCLPSESLRSSTLECFYNLSCIQLIYKYVNFTKSSVLLSTNTSRFPINTTIDILIDELFVEDWKTSNDYSFYYRQCLPSLCTYTYSQKLNSFYTLTLLMGIQGGLTIILKWITPKLVPIVILTVLSSTHEAESRALRVDSGDFNNDGYTDLITWESFVKDTKIILNTPIC